MKGRENENHYMGVKSFGAWEWKERLKLFLVSLFEDLGWNLKEANKVFEGTLAKGSR